MNTDQLIDHRLEQRIIGTTIASPTAATAYVQDHQVTVEHFADDAHRTVWALLVHRLDSDGTLDDITFDDTLRRHPDLSSGGVTPEQAAVAVAAAIDAADAEPNIEHVQSLKDLADRRRVARVLQTAGLRVGTLGVSLEETIAAVTEDVVTGSLVRRGPQIRSARQAIEETLQARRWENEAGPPGLTLGFSGLDRVMTLRAGQMTVVAARPSMGKSLFVQQVLEHVVRFHGVRALVFSMEMFEHELIDRLTASQARVPGRWLSHAKKVPGEHADRWERILAVSNDSVLDRYEFVDESDLSGAEIVNLVRRRKATHPDLQLVAVDYLGLIRKVDQRQLPVHALDEVTRALKVMANQQGVSVLLLCQFNRDAEKENRPPRLSDLRDSGAIEQAADNVIFLHANRTGPPGFGEDPGDSPVADQLIIAKQRSGQRQVVVPVGFDSDTPRFVDPNPAPPPLPPARSGPPLPNIDRPEAA